MGKNEELSMIEKIKQTSSYGELAELFQGVEQTPEIKKAALKKNGLMLEFVKEQTPEDCLMAVQEDGMAIQFVKKQTPELCMEAVKQDGMALKFVKEQTMEITEAAFEQNTLAKVFGKPEFVATYEENKKKEVEEALQKKSQEGANLDYEDYMRAQRESDEAFWSSLEGQGGSPNFTALEEAERNANEIAYRMHLAKEQQKKASQQEKAVRQPDRDYGFLDLEEAQRNVDDICLRMCLSEHNAKLGDDVSRIMNGEDISSGEINAGDAMDQLLRKYIVFCREQGVPEEVISLMSMPGFSLSQAMQIKFGYEDGLSVSEVAQYAKPELQKNEMVLCRFHLLREKEIGAMQAMGRMKEPGKKPSLDDLIKNGESRAHNDRSFAHEEQRFWGRE